MNASAQRLSACRAEVAEAEGMATSEIELSMGMSQDYALAVSDGVRHAQWQCRVTANRCLWGPQTCGWAQKFSDLACMPTRTQNLQSNADLVCH